MDERVKIWLLQYIFRGGGGDVNDHLKCDVNSHLGCSGKQQPEPEKNPFEFSKISDMLPDIDRKRDSDMHIEESVIVALCGLMTVTGRDKMRFLPFYGRLKAE